MTANKKAWLLHACGHVRLFPHSQSSPSATFGGFTWVLEKGPEREDGEFKKKGGKKGVRFVKCSAAKWPSVPTALSQWGQAVWGYRGDDERPGVNSRCGILQSTAVGGGSIALAIPVAKWKWCLFLETDHSKGRGHKSSPVRYQCGSLIKDTPRWWFP